MIFKIISLIVLTMLSGLLYRLGGWGDPGRKNYPKLPTWLFNTKARDLGCPLCAFLGMLFFVEMSWWMALAHFLSFGILFGALTTYWDFLFEFDNHWVHGFMCGLAYFPYAIVSGHWVGFGVRCVVVAIAMGLISTQSSDDVVEEVGRGASLIPTLPLMLL